MAGLPVDILELMINTPEQVLEYTSETKFEDAEGNFDMVSLINDNLKRTRASDDRVISLKEGLNSLVSQGAVSVQRQKEAIDIAATARGDIFGPEAQLIDVTRDINLAQFDQQVGIEAELRESHIDALDDINSLQFRARNVVADLFADLDIVDTATELGLADFIFDPIKSIKANVAAANAEKRIRGNKRELSIVTEAHGIFTKLNQAELAPLRAQTELIASAGIAAHYTAYKIGPVLERAKLEGKYTEAVVVDMAAAYSLDKDLSNMLGTQLNAELATGRATRDSINSLTTIMRDRQTTRRYEQIDRLAKEREEDLDAINGRFQQAIEVLELPYDNFNQYLIARSSGLTSSEQDATISDFLHTDLVGASAVKSSSTPVDAYLALAAVIGPEATTPGFQLMMSRIDDIALGQSVTDNIVVYAKDNQKTIREKHNRTMDMLFRSVDTDIDNLFRPELTSLNSPHNMGYTAKEGFIQNMPLSALETVGKWELDTHNFNAWVKNAISNAMESDQPLGIIAFALAAISQHQLAGMETYLGFNIGKMATPALGTEIKPIGDATNEGDWVTVLELAKIKVRRVEILRSRGGAALVAFPIPGN